jgi:HlyD family secretion protein
VGWSLAVVIVAGGYWKCSQGGSKEEVAYETEAVVLGDLTETVSANGTLNPVTLVNVGTQVSGTVRQLLTDFNERVRAGQVLLVLDDRIYSAAVRQLMANLRSATAQADLAAGNLKRGEAVFAKGVISQQDVEQLRQLATSAAAQRDVVAAQLDRERANLGYTVIRSPVSGVVVSREVDIGQTVAASFQTPTLFKIAQDLSKMQINGSFAEADIGRLAPGLGVKFTVDAYPDRTFTGAIREVRLQPKTVQNVVNYDVVISVDNPDFKLLPGMTAYVNVLLSERKGVLRVPAAAFRFKPPTKPGEAADKGKADGAAKRRMGGGMNGQRPDGAARDKEGRLRPLYVLRGKELERVMVRTAATDKRFVEILPGTLKAGDLVVTGTSGDAGRGPRMRMF